MQTCPGVGIAQTSRGALLHLTAPTYVRIACRFRAGPLTASRLRLRKQRACKVFATQASDKGAQLVPTQRAAVAEKEGPSTDFKVIWGRLWKVC